MTATPPKKSDLGVRTLSAIVMVAVAGTALWLGGWVWTAFVALVALGVLWEWWGLVRRFANLGTSRFVWLIAGLVYVLVAAAVLVRWRSPYDGIVWATALVLVVIAIDVGAYFAGRTIGGPKIAPSISPSKTWAGLIGGSIGAGIMLFAVSWAWNAGLCQAYFDFWDEPLPEGVFRFDDRCIHIIFDTPSAVDAWIFGLNGLIFAVVAQVGDFFESWMKRRAGVKDSGNLIPGHGGLFDRVDGLLAVCFVIGIVPLLFFAKDIIRLGYVPI
jgi:phosphatidate cytidylyltransferase